MDIKRILLANALFDNGNVQLHLEVYLAGISNSVFNLCGLFGRKALQEIFKMALDHNPSSLMFMSYSSDSYMR